MKALSIFLLVGIGVVAATLLFFCDPAQNTIYPACPFHRLTGWVCPGCGSTRALHALLHGHWRAALHFNAFVILSLPLLGGVGILGFWRHRCGVSCLPFRPAWLWAYFSAYLLFGILRDLPLPILAGFAP